MTPKPLATISYLSKVSLAPNKGLNSSIKKIKNTIYPPVYTILLPCGGDRKRVATIGARGKI